MSNKYVKEIRFIVIFLAKKFVLSMIIRIFATREPAKPLNDAQMCGSFFVYTLLNMANLIPFTKRFESSESLVNLLESRGLLICDRNKAIQYLDNIGYYRLSAYMYQPVMVYDMNGRKVNNPGKGVYIVNGMKIMKRQ